MEKSKIRISLIFLLIVAITGSLIRFIPFGFELIPYKNILHAHSHIGFQGWIYTGFFLVFTYNYLDKDKLDSGKFNLQFNLTILALVGVLISFIYQSYGVLSIIFSSLFQLVSYWFIFRFIKDAKSNRISLKIIKGALILNLISTIGPWVLGFIVAKGFSGTELYYSTVYFFLHFQYNGWFLFGLIGLLFWIAEEYNISFNSKKARIFFYMFFTSVFPTYFLSLIGMSFKNNILIISIVGCALLLLSTFYFLFNFNSLLSQLLQKLNGLSKLLTIIALILLFVKIILQIISIIPQLEFLAFQNKYVIMSYIHLSTIGVFTFFLLGYLFQFNWLKINFLSKAGVLLLILGFIFSELVLTLFGLSILITNYELWIFIFSSVMALGLTSILIAQYHK